jgi:hypothetical protein
MLKRLLLGFLFTTSIIWIAYYAWDIASEKNNYVPELVFSEADEEVLIVVRPNEVEFGAVPSFKNAPALSIMLNLNDSLYSRGYFSKVRPHMLLLSEENWTPKTIRKLFLGEKVRLDGRKIRVSGFEGSYYKNTLYLSQGTIDKAQQQMPNFPFDKKASASLLSIKKDNIAVLNDIYFKRDGRVDFITRDTDIIQGEQIKDAPIFSGLLSRNISTYHFYERDYYATLDPTFAQSPMYRWLLNGFVEVKYAGETVIISDYLGGQDPILILNDINQTIDSNRFDIPLTKNFPSKGKEYIIKYLEDAVVISESESACNKMIADYKLGNTIASSTSTRYRFFGALPKAVSERFISEDLSYSKSVYKGRLMETYAGTSIAESTKEMNPTVNLSCGFDIADFSVLPGIGNVAVLGKKGEIACFKDQKLAWRNQIDGNIKGSIEVIDLNYNNEWYILIGTESKIHLFNMEGEEASGFPIVLDLDITTPPKFYRWRERSYFLIGTADKKLRQFDAKGRELDIMKIDHNITQPIDIWASQQRLFAGLVSKSLEFTMYEVEKRRPLRSFNILPGSLPIKVPNQLYRFSVSENTLVLMNQKGQQTQIDSYANGLLIPTHSDAVLAILTQNTLHLLNNQGIGFGQIALPFSDIEDIFVSTEASGKTYICVIDGLENNVYLYGTDGKQLHKGALEGQTRVHVQTVKALKCITTVVDQFVIQYIEG